MKKQINPTIKAHIIRGAFYLLLLLAVWAIPFALAQSRSRSTTKPGARLLSPTISATQVVGANPDFAPPGLLERQFSSLRKNGAAALANSAINASGITNLGVPLFPDGGCGTPGPWATATPGPAARYRAGSATDGTYTYVYGGGDSSGGYYNDLWRWNPVTQTWTQLANMPTAKQNIQGAFWNGKIYVPGGFNGAHITENAIYDIATNTWSTGAPLPAAQTGANVAFNNKIYNFGGNPGPQNTVTIYDIATNTWSSGAPMPAAVTYGRAAVTTLLGQYAWYAGGITTVTVNTLYRYDFAANTWATMAPLQTARTSEELMTSPFGDQLYAVMGGDSTFFTGVPLPVSVEIYSIGGNSWTYGNPVVTKAAAPAGGRTGGQGTLMVQGGVDNTTYYDTVQVSVVPCGTPTPTATASPTPTAGASATPSPSCTPAWQNEPPMLTARAFASGAVANNFFYVLTGFNGTSYEVATDYFNGSVWASGAPIPVGHSQSKAATVGNSIYVPGGYNSLQFSGPIDLMQIYDSTTNTWSNGMNLPATRSGAAVVAFNGKVYIIGGFTLPFPTGTDTVYIYDPVANSYTTGAPMPAPAGNTPGALLGNEIFVVGGSNSATLAHYAYNPVTDTWRTIAAPSPPDCQAGTAFALNGELWLLGCLGEPGMNVNIYNPGSDSWRAGPPLNVSQEGGSANGLYNTRGFVAGGGVSGAASTTVESVGPCGPSATPTATSTATSTSTPTSTPTSTSCPTVTSTPTATATATATAEPRPTPTPRPRPTPAPRP